jgi:hypothetical protein
MDVLVACHGGPYDNLAAQNEISMVLNKKGPQIAALLYCHAMQRMAN